MHKNTLKIKEKSYQKETFYAYMNKSDFHFMIKPVLTAGHWWKHEEVSLALSKHLDLAEWALIAQNEIPWGILSNRAYHLRWRCLLRPSKSQQLVWEIVLEKLTFEAGALSWHSLLRSHNCPFTREAGFKNPLLTLIHITYFSPALNSSELYFSHL